MLKESKGVNEIEKETREGLSNNFRILTVEDVGDAFEQVIEADDNGGVYIVFPDVPLVKFPEINSLFIIPVIAYSKLIALFCPQWKRINGAYAIPLVFFLMFFIMYLLFNLIS